MRPSYPTLHLRCDFCSAPAIGIVRLVGFPGDQLPRACKRDLPRAVAMLDTDPAFDGIEVMA